MDIAVVERLSPVSQIDKALLYEDHKRLIFQIVNKFQRIFRIGDSDELLSEGNDAFMHAAGKWEPERGKFTTLLYWCVWNKLLSWRRRQNVQRSRFKSTDFHATEVPSRRNFNLTRFVLELSWDAGIVAELIFEEPIEQVMERKHRQNCRKLYDSRSAIGDYLLDEGWTAERIAKSFQELKEVLCP